MRGEEVDALKGMALGKKPIDIVDLEWPPSPLSVRVRISGGEGRRE